MLWPVAVNDMFRKFSACVCMPVAIIDKLGVEVCSPCLVHRTEK